MRTFWFVFALVCVASPLRAQEVCGDGVIEGEEQCDRDLVANAGYQFRGELRCNNFGFSQGTLGCAADCEGWRTANCYDGIPEQLCGNGRVEAGRFPEQCDSPLPFWSDDCRCQALPAGSAVCGNGCRDVGEECDSGPSCGAPGTTEACQWVFECGNDVIEALEQCDDGSGNSDTVPDACRDNCRNAHCGDGVIDTGEACDDAADNSDTEPDACRTACIEPFCGDGVVDGGAGEICDQGEANSADRDALCNLVCLPPGCGNGIHESWEACDDGNEMDGDGCSGSCDSDETCGNDIVDRAVGEQCDDGNLTPDDGCSATCELESCGDGVLNPGETCDDGNEVDGDGCNATCTSDESCGNEIVDVAVGEECDDGNTERDDGCNEACGIERCANGYIEGLEECDDGGVVPDDGCSPLCAVEPEWTCSGEPSTCTRARVDGGVDAAMPDAGAPDANSDAGETPSGGGCGGCATSEGTPWLALLLLLALGVRRRGRRRG